MARKLSLIFFLSIVAWPSAAETVFTWNKCIEMSVENNADLLSARANYKSLKELEGDPRAGFFPTVTANLGGTRSSLESEVSANGVNTTVENANTSYTANLTATQNVFSGFSDLGKTRSAEARTRGALANVDLVKAKLSSDLKAGYQTLMYAIELTKLTQEIIRRREYNLRLVELSFQGGRENKGSVLLSRANLEQAKFDDLQARDSIMTARAGLARILGLDEADDFTIQGDIPVYDPPQETLNFQTLALATPNHRQVLSQVEEAQGSVLQGRSGFFPQLSVSGSVGRLGDEFFPQNNQWSVGVNLSWSLFNGLRDYSKSKGATEAFAAADMTRLSTDRQLLVQLKQAYVTYVESVAQLKVDASFREAAAMRAEIARKQYNNGLLSFQDWDTIESDYIKRQKNYLATKRDRVINESNWEKALGRGVIP